MTKTPHDRDVAIARAVGVLALAGLAVLSGSARWARGATCNPLEGIRATRQISGPDFKLTQARGRVVLLLYWGIHSADSKGVLSTLAAVQDKYAADKRVVVVASHVQTMGQEVREFLKSLHPAFPVFQGLEIPGSPAGEEVPTALLFTHTGAMTAQGELKSLLRKLDSLVSAAPEPLPDPTILDGVALGPFRTEAVQLVPGKSAADSFAFFEARVKGGGVGAGEAAGILKKARAWMAAETKRMAELSATKPATALAPLRALAATTAGLPEGQRPAALLAELEKDPNVAVVSELAGTVNVLVDKIYREGENIEAGRQAAGLQEHLEACLERSDLTGALRDEAKALTAAIADVGLGTAMWLTNYNEALRRAKAARKPVLACFTGSDWCLWCIRLQNEVFETPEFKAWAGQNVILLEVDFPRHKALSPAAVKANDALQDKYVIRGFPTVLFLDADGAVLGKSGYLGGGPQRWIERARSAISGQ